MSDERGDRWISNRSRAEVVESETIAWQGSQKTQRRCRLEKPSRGWDAQVHPDSERLASSGTSAKKLKNLKLHAGAENL